MGFHVILNKKNFLLHLKVTSDYYLICFKYSRERLLMFDMENKIYNIHTSKRRHLLMLHIFEKDV